MKSALLASALLLAASAPSALGQLVPLARPDSASSLLARTTANASFDHHTGVLLHAPDDPYFDPAASAHKREWRGVSLGLMLEARDASAEPADGEGIQKRAAGQEGGLVPRDVGRQEVEFGLTERGTLVWPDELAHLAPRGKRTAKLTRRAAKKHLSPKARKRLQAKRRKQLLAKQKKARAAKLRKQKAKKAAQKKKQAKAKKAAAARRKAANAKKAAVKAVQKKSHKKASSKKGSVKGAVKKVVAQVKTNTRKAAQSLRVTLASSIPTFRSVITWYNKDGLENPYCAQSSGWTPTDASFIAAVTEKWGDRPACGSFLQLTAPNSGKSIVVRVVDLCGGCKAGVPHVDLSVSAFQALYALDIGEVGDIVVATLAGSPVPTNEWTSALTTLYGPVNL